MPGAAIDTFIDLMNRYGAEREPFLFITDFDLKIPEIYKLNSVPTAITFQTPILSNINRGQIYTKHISFKKHPIPFGTYSEAFRNVQKHIKLGNTYLLNLTFPTLIETMMTLEEIFNASVAKYKLLYHNRFVVFSPETFVRIKDGVIKSYPMKGTIDSSVPDAEMVLLKDEKEEAEHNTIIDLIRNDLSKVADNVAVTRYRYIDRIRSVAGELLQMSSEITGDLLNGYENNLGNIIAELLPAGSVTGAPKKETLRIIKESEKYERGWYTGVFGVFDGKSLDSAVMIRYIEKEADKLFFKSGGGITYLSDPVKEYEELISKVYVPVS
ncbi:MAG: aminodeoxychorismate synthase component I [Bacteroidetes bacterium]|nr:MAG: aminodeoxychorismate synthase component I [Bacteroidota bacterium]